MDRLMKQMARPDTTVRLHKEQERARAHAYTYRRPFPLIPVTPTLDYQFHSCLGPSHVQTYPPTPPLEQNSHHPPPFSATSTVASLLAQPATLPPPVVGVGLAQLRVDRLCRRCRRRPLPPHEVGGHRPLAPSGDEAHEQTAAGILALGLDRLHGLAVDRPGAGVV